MGYSNFSNTITISSLIYMLNQYKLTLLKEEDRQKIFDKKGDKLVYIDSKGGFYRPDARGYTDKKEEAWVLPLRDAYDHTKHCGEEKRVRFLYLPETTPEDYKTITTLVNDILEGMYNDGIMDKIDIDSKAGRLILLERYIDQLRVVNNKCREYPDYINNVEKINLFVKKEIERCYDRDQKLLTIWTHFLIKVGMVPSPVYLVGVICFCIPILIDCWDNKIR